MVREQKGTHEQLLDSACLDGRICVLVLVFVETHESKTERIEFACVRERMEAHAESSVSSPLTCQSSMKLWIGIVGGF
jgi:hypothetical protein